MRYFDSGVLLKLLLSEPREDEAEQLFASSPGGILPPASRPDKSKTESREAANSISASQHGSVSDFDSLIFHPPSCPGLLLV